MTRWALVNKMDIELWNAFRLKVKNQHDVEINISARITFNSISSL